MPKIVPEETLESRQAFSGRLIDVRVDSVKMADGRTARREVVEHPQVVAILPVLDDGRLVMVRQFRHAVGKILLEIPAGGIEKGETPEAAVGRELREETGYQAGKLEHLVSFYTSPGFTTEYMHLFRATELRPGTPEEAADEVIELLELSAREAWDHVRNGEVQDCKTLLALCFSLDNPPPIP